MQAHTVTARLGLLLLGARLVAAPSQALTADEARTLAEEVYVFGYPLVLMNVTAKVFMAERSFGWNHFSHLRDPVTIEYNTVVGSNVDTLYSLAYLDLSRQPVVLHVPNVQGRYYQVQMMDGWTETFASLGTRTTGTKPSDFAVVGPRWTGAIPDHMQRINALTDFVWVLVRIQTNGASDYPEIRAMQDGFSLKPLKPLDRPNTAPVIESGAGVDLKVRPVDQVDRMTAPQFFSTLARALEKSQPHAEDSSIVVKLTRLGIKPSEEFDSRHFAENLRSAMDEGVRTARQKIRTRTALSRRPVGGNWYSADPGVYGTDYQKRAVVAQFGLGALPPEDARYAQTRVDAENVQLNGARRYVLRFERDQFPPARAFWSVTLYGEDHYFVANPIGRYAIRDRDPVEYGADGSLEIYIQTKPPAEKEANWLPAPPGDFTLGLRIYWPRKEVLEWTWQAPPVRRVN